MKAGKRLFDVVLSFAGLAALSPAMAAIAAAVKLGDGGPVFFLQERVGRGFRPFRIIKFRTMSEGTAEQGPRVTAEGDPRVTKVGRFLRKHKLDELPQLINVLKGDMSLVGPRPEVRKFVEAFPEEFREILAVRPGVTDYASIMYRDEEALLGGAEDPESLYVSEVLPVKLGLNAKYVRSISVSEDVRIIFRTLYELYRGRHAARFARFRGRLEGLLSSLSRYRAGAVLAFHAAAVAASVFISFNVVYNGEPPRRYGAVMPWCILAVVALRMPVFKAFGVFKGLWRYTGVVDLVKIVAATTAGTVLIFFAGELWVFRQSYYPRLVVALDWVLTIGLLSSFRLAMRFYRDYRLPDAAAKGRRVLVVGAGNAGEMIVRDMKKNPLVYDPVGFVDDDPAKTGLCIHGVPILGGVDSVKDIIPGYRPEEILIAIPSAKPATLVRLMNRLSPCRLPIKTLPNLVDLLKGSVSVNQIRPLKLGDLLTRPPVKADAGRLKGFVAGRKVMVTGAGGSIGSELCRQALSLGAKAVIAFERHENSLYNLECEVKRAPQKAGQTFFPVVGDVNDRLRVAEIVKDFRPDIIYHAAAHKHVPMMEMNPREAIYNNILGTRTVARAAKELGVGRFVLISTDKAVNPTSVMGASKRACELFMRAISEGAATKFITVRFGNVLGSSGSVVPLFCEQIRKGGPVTVTHPEMERYLMLIPEAVQLVIQASSIGAGGEIFVLDMGEPIKIADLAKNLIMLSGFDPDRDIKIKYIGLRPGEKLFEELFDKEEEVTFTSQDKIFKAVSRNLPDREAVFECVYRLEGSLGKNDPNELLRLLAELVHTYNNGNARTAPNGEFEKAA